MKTLRLLLIALILITIAAVQAQETAYELPAIQSGDTVEGLFEENIISQLYGFYASAGDSLSISMVQDNDNLDPFLVLLNSEGAVLAYDDDSGEEAYSALISYEVEEDGAYFVLATSEYSHYLDGTVSEVDEEQGYSLSITGHTTPTTVEDAELVTLELSPMSVGTQLSGESSEETPAAFFIFEGEAGTSVSLSLDADFFSVVYLFAPDGSRIAVDPALVSMELEEDGVYLVMVADYRFHEAIDDDGDFEGGDFSLELGN